MVVRMVRTWNMPAVAFLVAESADLSAPDAKVRDMRLEVHSHTVPHRPSARRGQSGMRTSVQARKCCCTHFPLLCCLTLLTTIKLA